MGKKEEGSLAGTAEYLSPEMISLKPYDQGVDWWAFGTLLYEMMVGLPPFFQKNRHKMYHSIKRDPIAFPNRKQHGI